MAPQLRCAGLHFVGKEVMVAPADQGGFVVDFFFLQKKGFYFFLGLKLRMEMKRYSRMGFFLDFMLPPEVFSFLHLKMAPKGIRRFLFPKPSFLAFHVKLVNDFVWFGSWGWE